MANATFSSFDIIFFVVNSLVYSKLVTKFNIPVFGEHCRPVFHILVATQTLQKSALFQKSYQRRINEHVNNKYFSRVVRFCVWKWVRRRSEPWFKPPTTPNTLPVLTS